MSINLVVASPTRVVACADSRVSCSDPAIPTTDNGAPKIFQAGTSSIAGHVGIGLVAAFNHAGELRDSPRKILEAFRGYFGHPLLAELGKPEHAEFLKRILPGTPVVTSSFVLTQKPSGEIDLLELTFPLRAREDGTPQLGEPEITVHKENFRPVATRSSFLNANGFVYLRCATSIEATFLQLAGQINPDLADADILRDVDRVFQAAGAQNPACALAIGGTIVVAAIDAEGFRWLRKWSA